MKATLDLFVETLAFINPEVEDVTHHEFIQECHGRCKRWQDHLTGHLQHCTDEALFGLSSSLFLSFRPTLLKHVLYYSAAAGVE